MKSITLILLTTLFWGYSFSSKSQDYKSKVVFDLIFGPTMVVSKAELNSFSYSAQTNVNFRNSFYNDFYSSVGLGYSYLYLNDLVSTLYDPMLVTDIVMNADISQSYICFPLAIGYSRSKLNVELVFNLKYLFSSRITSEVLNTYDPNVPGKYEFNNDSNIGEYTSFNYGIGPKLEFFPNKRFSIFYRFTYDLEVNPTYSYTNTYNTINNQIGISIYPNK